MGQPAVTALREPIYQLLPYGNDRPTSWPRYCGPITTWKMTFNRARAIKVKLSQRQHCQLTSVMMTVTMTIGIRQPSNNDNGGNHQETSREWCCAVAVAVSRSLRGGGPATSTGMSNGRFKNSHKWNYGNPWQLEKGTRLFHILMNVACWANVRITMQEESGGSPSLWAEVDMITSHDQVSGLGLGRVG